MNNPENHHHRVSPAGAVRISKQDFARWGSDVAAYIKSVGIVDQDGHDTGATAYAIHAADGRHMGNAPTRDLAFAAVIREGLEPVSVH